MFSLIFFVNFVSFYLAINYHFKIKLIEEKNLVGIIFWKSRGRIKKLKKGQPYLRYLIFLD